ncbi:class I SAM-dependent methyltransferase [Yeosuana marina]|uniref:class I SAM-dependent methyltransferase n=1 Tax=Yeosuana marina TaxID=1565536 RepID=UPI00141F89EC|nr:class I SAM-dependent methyltransferase [Yeosuana marina]
METYKETFRTWNKVASIYEDKFMDLDLYNDTYDFFTEQIPTNNPEILEIGCGPGNITKYVLGKRPDFKLTAIDIAPNMIKLAKKNNPNGIFKVLDIRNITTIRQNFNGILAGFCVSYLSQIDGSKLIQDCHKLLSSSGILYISFVEGIYEDSAYQIGSSGDRVFFYYHGLDFFKNILETNHFTIIKLYHKNFHKTDKTTETHTIMIARKHQ